MSKLQRLVVLTTCSDGCSYSFDQVTPVLYESSESLYCHLEEKFLDCKNNEQYEFLLAGYTWDCSELGEGREFSIEVLTIDEWFIKVEAPSSVNPLAGTH